MALRLILFFSLLYLNQCSSLFAQVVVDTIVVRDLFSIHQGNNAITISQDGSPNTEALKTISSLQVQQSAVGGLQTILFRGMSSRHISLLWNGVNIQSPINGVFDISLVPFEAFDDTKLYTSVANTNAGLNAIAGTILLKSNTSKKEKSINASWSTLQNYDFNAKTYWVTPKTVHHISASLSCHANAYYYKLGTARLKRQTTDFNLVNITYTGEAILSKNSTLKGEVWVQAAKRVIPTSIIASPIPQRQNDQNRRLNLSYHYSFKQYRWDSSLSYLDENLDYLSPGIYSISNNQVWNLSTTLASNENHNKSVMINYRKDVIKANFFARYSQPVRNTMSIFGFRKYEWTKNRQLQLNVRQDLVDLKLMPTSVSITYALGKHAISFNRNYQLPTFNDLYWPQGGNQNLQTELSHQGEINTKFALSTIGFKAGIYLNHVDNWIQWIPTNTGIWRPYNYKSVLARGLELQAIKTYKHKSGDLILKVDYSYNPTTNLTQISGSNGKNLQLIYIPLHKSALKIDYQNRKLKTGIEAIVTSKRFDTTDHSSFLPTYLLLNANIGYDLHPIILKLDINNLTNTDYAIVRFFPQVGTNTTLSIKYIIN